MIVATDNHFYLLMYQHDDGDANWWGLYDSLETAAKDGPWCYENQTDKRVGLEQSAKIMKDLLDSKKYSNESDGLYLWIDGVTLYTDKEK